MGHDGGQSLGDPQSATSLLFSFVLKVDFLVLIFPIGLKSLIDETLSFKKIEFLMVWKVLFNDFESFLLIWFFLFL